MNEDLTPFEALEMARDIAGGQAGLARICKRSQPTVWKWFQSSKLLPAEHVLPVEAATGIDRTLLRPDIYPRGLVDGVPYNPDEPLLDVFTPIKLNRQAARDTAADARFHGVDRRAGAQL